MKHIISLSGGIGSYFTLKRVLEKVDKKEIELVFCDTKFEDEDLYRFLKDIENKFSIKIKILTDGRTPIELSEQEKFLYNSRVANCSKVLKSKMFREYLKTLTEEATLYFGIDFTEAHRCKALIRNYSQYKVEFPMCKQPYLYKNEMIEMLKEDGIEIPKLYKLGFSHNNCAGRCFKGGIGHYKKLYEKLPNNYKEMEEAEKRIAEKIGKKVTILKRKGNPFSLEELRMLLEQEPEQLTLFECHDVGGCGCFADD